METKMTNEQKAKELARDYFRRGQLGFVSTDTESAGFDCAMKIAQWKDEQFKEMLQSLPQAVKDLIETLSK